MGNAKLVKKAVELINLNFGEYMGDLYNDFYKEKSDSEILQSLESLLEDLLGENNAKKQIAEISAELKIKIKQEKAYA